MNRDEFTGLFSSVVLELEDLRNSPNLSAYIDTIIQDISDLSVAGRKEYASDEDVFSNFRGIAEYASITKEAVLLVYLKKHIDGIRSYVRGHRSQREDVRGRINDAIVYLILLRAMVESNQETNGE